MRQVDFAKSTAESNRAVLEQAVRTTSADGRAPGLVAYRDGDAVGWVSLGPREDYQRLQHSRVMAPIDDRPVWSIVCFVVARTVRKQGIANALLEAAIGYAREHGATLLEAYPVETDGRRILAANVYKGTLTMFERAGFGVAARRQANRSSPVRPIVRRKLRRN
jgi:GNAT superfamily N-acetyltransferase